MAAILDPRAADVAVLDPGATDGPAVPDVATDLVSPDQVSGSSVADPAVVTAGPAPTGGPDPAAVATVAESAVELHALLRRLLIDRDVDREEMLAQIVTVVAAGLRPDAVAVAGALEQLWGLGTDLLDGAFPATGALPTVDQVRAQLAPYADLADAVSRSASAVLSQFTGLWPPAEQLPAPFPTIAGGFEAFFAGLVDTATGEGLNTSGYWTQILTNLQTSLAEHCIVGPTVVEAGIVAGIAKNLGGDLVGLAGLILLAGSGPVLVGLLAFAAYSAWEAGVDGVAHELGSGLASLVMQPLQTLHDTTPGVEFLYRLGEIIGPVLLDLLLWATGAEPLALVAEVMTSAKVASAIGVLRRLFPVTAPQPLLEMIDAIGPELRAGLREALLALSADGASLVDDLAARPGSASIVADLADYVEELDGNKDALAQVVYALRALASMTSEEFEAMVVISERLPATGPFAHFGLVELLADGEAGPLTTELAGLLGPIVGSMDPRDYGLASVIGSFFGNDSQRTGARGALRVAAELVAESAPTFLRFEESELRRVVDIVATRLAVDSAGREVIETVLSVEVKAYPAGTLAPKSATKLMTQMGRDLLRVLTAGDTTFETLRWYLDDAGYDALHAEFEGLFVAALGAIRGDLQRLGLDPAEIEVAVDVALANGSLLRRYHL